MIRAVACLLVLGSIAIADNRSDVTEAFNALALSMGVGAPPKDMKPPRMVLNETITVAPDRYDDVLGGWGQIGGGSNAVVAFASDGKAAWVAMDFTFGHECGMESCMHDPPDALAHGTGLFEQVKAGWQPVVWDFARIVSAKEQAKLKTPAAIDRKIDAGGEQVVKLLETTLGDPAAFAKTISDRKDVVMFGSELKERFVGGAAVRAQLAKWKLAFKVRDGVVAGLTTSKTVAWLVANVDAGKLGAKQTTPYRLLAIYEKTGAAWQVVQLNFGSATGP